MIRICYLIPVCICIFMVSILYLENNPERVIKNVQNIILPSNKEHKNTKLILPVKRQ
ncbi:hypothetical protein SAMN02927916_3211 [Flavobacterium anhuiense]|uniref:Uncharacterized protein n=1 Tax=Flavobacterium anhuiense TaxID=459526 RepID=A0ABY0LX78_9FLAO|nr:hypothetical protein SAMN02927916_3211 [Flavobacterium anhuiense]